MSEFCRGQPYRGYFAHVTDAHKRRLADNEALFREINERVQAQAETHGDDGHVYAYFCECSRPGCVERVHTTSAEYEQVRAHAKRFILAAGHEIDDIEEVVDEIEDVVDDMQVESVVVEKQGVAGARAEELDPRAV
jgi:hypothetical protein